MLLHLALLPVAVCPATLVVALEVDTDPATEALTMLAAMEIHTLLLVADLNCTPKALKARAIAMDLEVALVAVMVTTNNNKHNNKTTVTSMPVIEVLAMPTLVMRVAVAV